MKESASTTEPRRAHRKLDASAIDALARELRKSAEQATTETFACPATVSVFRRDLSAILATAQELNIPVQRDLHTAMELLSRNPMQHDQSENPLYRATIANLLVEGLQHLHGALKPLQSVHETNDASEMRA